MFKNCKLIFIFLVVAAIFGGCDFYYKNMPFASIPPQAVSGPVVIGPEWVEITPPEPLKPLVDYQWISLGFYGENKGDFIDFTSKGTFLILEDNKRTRIEAFLFDDKGESYELDVVGRGAGIILRRKIADKTPNGKSESTSSSFPTDRFYTKLKIRSEISISCDKIEWAGSKPQ